MSDEQPPSDSSGQHVLRDSLAEIRQSLDALASRYQRPEADRSPAPSGPRPPDSRDPSSALSLGREVLAIPSAGLEPTEVFSSPRIVSPASSRPIAPCSSSGRRT